MQAARLLLVSGAALLLGCEDRPSAATEQESAGDTTPPVISYVILNRNPNPTVPLAAILSLSTDEPTEMTVRIDDGERAGAGTGDDGPVGPEMDPEKLEATRQAVERVARGGG